VDPGVTLLERSLTYALGAVGGVSPGVLTRPTPCADWDLGMLLEHLVESMDALLEGLDAACVGPVPAVAAGTGDPVPAFRRRATALLGSCAAAAGGGADGTARAVLVGDRVLAARILTWVGAVELAVHGWDVAQACGSGRPIPPGLSRHLLAIVPLVVTDATRQGQFAPPRATPPGAGPGDRLVAFLGRELRADR
jgi:uncharacterized protein (TIGR03086 family)